VRRPTAYLVVVEEAPFANAVLDQLPVIRETVLARVSVIIRELAGFFVEPFVSLGLGIVIPDETVGVSDRDGLVAYIAN